MPKTVAAVASPRCATLRWVSSRCSSPPSSRQSCVRPPRRPRRDRAGMSTDAALRGRVYGSCPFVDTATVDARGSRTRPGARAGAPARAADHHLLPGARERARVPSTDGPTSSQAGRAGGAGPLPRDLLQPRRRPGRRTTTRRTSSGGRPRATSSSRRPIPVTTSRRHHQGGARDQRDQVRDARFVLDHVLALNRVAVARRWSRWAPRSQAHRGRRSLDGRAHDARTGVGLLPRSPGQGRGRPRRRVGEPTRGPDPAPSGPILFAHATYDVAVPFQSPARLPRRQRSPKYLLEVRFPVAGVVAHLLPFFPGFGATWVDVGHVVDEFLAAYLAGDRSARSGIAAAARARFLHLSAAR